MEKLANLISAAKHGSIEAMYELGMMYYSGDGVSKDERLAFKWLKRAADKGDKTAEELYRQLNADRKEVYLTKLLGEDYIAKYGKAVVLHCSVCGDACTTPLTATSNVDYQWVRLTAYSCVDFVDNERLDLGMYKVGKKLKICMRHPFYCKIGDTFSVTFGDFSRFITCQLIGILKLEKSYANVCVKVISEGTYLSFVKPVSEKMKDFLGNNQRYDYVAPRGNFRFKYGGEYKYGPLGEYVDDRVFMFYNGMGGGDEIFSDFIYTDDDGIDHLILNSYHGFHENECFYGDKIIGYHKNCPYLLFDAQGEKKQIPPL